MSELFMPSEEVKTMVMRRSSLIASIHNAECVKVLRQATGNSNSLEEDSNGG
ncbi:MAG: hypothetical protein M3447_12725 [Acidobacteriota bacterium]|nr:hypothetical protein [Acidobacteriota bacterium]